MIVICWLCCRGWWTSVRSCHHLLNRRCWRTSNDLSCARDTQRFHLSPSCQQGFDTTYALVKRSDSFHLSPSLQQGFDSTYALVKRSDCFTCHCLYNRAVIWSLLCWRNKSSFICCGLCSGLRSDLHCAAHTQPFHMSPSLQLGSDMTSAVL